MSLSLRSTKTISKRWRKYFPLLALLALALATLACINTDLKIKVSQTEGAADTLKIDIEQYLSESFIAAAKVVNQERKADFAAAGRKTDLEDLLPTSRSDISDMFNSEQYQELGFTVTTTDTGFSATKQGPLDKDEVTEGWTIKVIQDPAHPGLITYRVKVRLDLTNMEGDDLFELRYQPQMEKPNLAPGSSYTPSEGFLGGLMDGLGAAAGDAQQELAIELYYVQKALKASEPIEYRISVELPGTVVLHKLDGTTAGTLDGNLVTLVLDEKTIGANGGKELVFHVESIVKDCSKACDKNYHLIWDGDEDGVSCNCICEKGFEVIEGENACVNCDTVCSWSDPDLVTDLINCENNTCACRCKDGMAMNNAGTACIDEYDAWVEDQQRSDEGEPSAQALADLFAALLDPENDKNINEMPGWFLLTSGERENFLVFLEALGLAVDRTQLIIDLGPDMTTDQRNQLIKEEQNRLENVRQAALIKAEEKFEHRQKVQEEIIKKISGLSYYAQYIPALISNYFTTPYDLAVGYVEDKLTEEVTNRIKQEAYGDNPSTISEAAEKLVEEIPKLATKDTVNDYYLYQEMFDKKYKECGINCSDAEAVKLHYQVLVELRPKIKTQHLEWAKDGAAYDLAFRVLNRSVPQNKDY